MDVLGETAEAEVVLDDSASSQDVEVAVADGHAVAWWLAPSEGTEYVHCARYTAGQGWQAAERVPVPPWLAFSAVRLAVDAHGQLVVAWIAERALWVRRADGAGWRDPVRLDPGGALLPQTFALALAGSGTAAVAWWAVDCPDPARACTGGSSLWSRRSVGGGAWSEARAITTSAQVAALRAPRLAVLAGGAVTLVWNQGGSSGPLLASTDPGDATAVPYRLDTTSTESGRVDPFDLAVDAAGGAAVIWVGDGNAGGVRMNQIQASRRFR